MTNKSALLARILKNIVIDANGCWIWQRRINDKGYGVITINQKKCRPHRVTYEICIGPIPPGLYVCHKCDVRACCNPDHLFVGEAKDNMDDCAVKGRIGGQLSRQKFSEIRAMLKAGHSHKTIVMRLGVSQGTVSNVKSGRVGFGELVGPVRRAA